MLTTYKPGQVEQSADYSKDDAPCDPLTVFVSFAQPSEQDRCACANYQVDRDHLLDTAVVQVYGT